MEQHETHLTRENSLFQYSAALERGDFETVAAILQRAETDSRLAQMIFEVNDEYAKELEPIRKETRVSAVLKNLRWDKFRPTRATVALTVGALLLALLFLPILPPTAQVSSVRAPSGAGNPNLLVPPPESSAVERRLSVVAWLSQQARGARYSADQPYSAALLPTDVPSVGATLALNGYVIDLTPFMMATLVPGQPTLPAQLSPPTSSMIEVTPIGGSTPALTATPAALAAPPAGQGNPSGSVTPVPVQPQERMIVKNGEIDLLVKSAGTAIDQVTQIATDNGGYVLTSQTYLDGPARYATLTIAVRADQFETAMRRLRQSAIEVLRELSTGQDVSTEYVDLQSRLRNLEVTRDRIQAFLADAVNVQEALEINRQLADIEAQIEQVKGRMTYLSGRSAFSTITVNLQEKVDATPTPTPTVTPTPTPTPPWSLVPTFDEAAETQVNLLRGLLEVLTWLVVVPGPYLFTLALIVWIVRSIKGHRGGPSAKSPQTGP